MYKCAAKIVLLLSVATGMNCAGKMEMPEFDAVRVEAFIADPCSGESRTSMSGSKASFTSGDNIGVYETLTGRSNVSYTYNGTTWSTASPMYWRDGVSTHTFYAYYPYKSANSGMSVSVPVLSNQTIGATPNPAFDLLVSGAKSQIRSSGVGLTFTHAFTLIQINVKMGILGLINLYDLNSITIRGGNLPTSTSPYGIANKTGSASDVGYNFVAGAVQADANTPDRFTQSFTINVTGVSILTTGITLYIFVLPGTYTSPVPAISFKVSLLGLVSTSTYANFANTTFLPGTKYSYDVSIGKLLRSPEQETTLLAREIVPLTDNQPFNFE